MVKELITMDMPIESVYHDYKFVADSIVDDESFQKADTGILLSNLYDAVKALEKQIPKEPFQLIKYTDYFHWECPICHMSYGMATDKVKYCFNCGQAIKWE